MVYSIKVDIVFVLNFDWKNNFIEEKKGLIL